MLSRVKLLIFFAFVATLGLGSELTLPQAIQLALANHPDVRRAELQLSVAELKLAAAQAKAIFPTLSLSLTPSNEAIPQASFSAAMNLPIGSSTKLTGRVLVQPDQGWHSSWSLGFSLNLSLANPMAAGDTLTSLAQAVDEARAALEKTKANVVVNVIKSYADLLSLKAKADQAKVAMEKAAQDLAAAEKNRAAGLVSELDLLQSRLTSIQAQLAYEQARESYETQKIRFIRDYLGLNEEPTLVPFALPEEKLVAAGKELLASVEMDQALEATSEVKAAKIQVEEAKKALEQTRLSWLPVVSIEAGLSPEGLRFGWTLQFDLFSPDRGAQVKMAEAQVQLSELALETARSSARQQLSERCSTLASALQAWERLPLEQEKWTLQEEINRTKYNAGLLSESEWLDFQREKEAFLLESQQRLVDVFLAYLGLQAALGKPVNWEDWLQ